MSIYNIADLVASKIKYSKKPFQNLINAAYTDSRFSLFQTKEVEYLVHKGLKFLPSEHLETLVDVPNWLDKVRPEDTVLNLGACIGSIAIPISKECKKVIAVEPIWYKELQANIDLNKLGDKIEIKPFAIRSPLRGTSIIRYGSRSIVPGSFSFRSLITNIERPDYLVCDIEGDEWDIIPEDLVGIREIRIEYHLRRDSYQKDRLELLGRKISLLSHRYIAETLPVKHTSPSILFKEIKYLKASKIE